MDFPDHTIILNVSFDSIDCKLLEDKIMISTFKLGVTQGSILGPLLFVILVTVATVGVATNKFQLDNWNY